MGSMDRESAAMPECNHFMRFFCTTLIAALSFAHTTTTSADERPDLVRPAIRVTESAGSKPTARLVQYEYYSGGWGWGSSYRGWGGAGWGGYGGWGAYTGLPNYMGWGGYAPAYGTYYGGYPNYVYPSGYFDYGLYGMPGYGYSAYGYPYYGYPTYYGGYSCGCGSGDGLGYRIW
jgi:hypothetical protein